MAPATLSIPWRRAVYGGLSLLFAAGALREILMQQQQQRSEKRNRVPRYRRPHAIDDDGAQLPRGRQLRLELLSTWGDAHYIGLAAVQLWDEAMEYADEVLNMTPIAGRPPALLAELGEWGQRRRCTRILC